MKYRIIKEDEKNMHGLSCGVKFYVKELKPFLFFWTRWYYIKHKSMNDEGLGGYVYTPTPFRTSQNAKHFIKNIMCGDEERDGMQLTTVGEYDCTTINN
jgi:hypothetical protein